MLTFQDFTERIEVIEGQREANLRLRYITAFVDIATWYYRRNIAKTDESGFYVGYLWDCFIDPKVISEVEMDNIIHEMHDIYVMWDLHADNKVAIPGYWRFPKASVLRMAGDTLVRGAVWLPEDLYIFDDSFEWTIAATHESWEGVPRACYWAVSKGVDRTSPLPFVSPQSDGH